MLESEKGGKGSFIGATLLIAGICVGGGMLALPVETGAVGFWPSMLSLVICWAFMTLTGLLLVEANLWFEEGAHFDTMARKLLGRFGEIVSIVFYLFMGYASLVAYNSGGAALLTSFFEHVLQIPLTHFSATLLFAFLFGTALFMGTWILGRINTILFFGMVIAYIFLVGFGAGEVSDALLTFKHWSGMGETFPLLLAAFSFQMIVPSLTPYLNRNRKALNGAVVLGSSIALFVYAIWLFVILGTIPYFGEHGLQEAMQQGLPATSSMRHFVKSPWLFISAEYFSFFALVTSYLGIALGTFDFLSDLFKVKEKGVWVLVLGLLVIVPTLIFTLYYPGAFLQALEISGGFGDSILDGILPVLMVYSGRYVQKRGNQEPPFGGRLLLLTLFAFAVYVFVIQVVKLVA